jgi:RNA polymerase sigma-70 factor (ECF subfamily)
MSGEADIQGAAELVRQVLAGDRDAYAPLVDAWQDRVRAAVAGYCRSAEEVEEIAHLAFVEAYRKLGDFDPARGSFPAWLLTIARTCLLAELRRRRSEGQRAARYLEIAAAAPSAPADIESRRRALERCLEELKPDETRLVEGRYRQNLSSERLAAGAGRSAGAVRMALQRIRERLRDCIERRTAGEVGQ